jgi:hypothetical protein
MAEPKQTSDVVFFLGAGVSVPARVPDTRGFVTDFRRDVVEGQEPAPAFDETIRILSGVAPDGVDVELLLDALARIRTRQGDLLLQFVDGTPRVSNLAALDGLEGSLRDYIRKRAIVPADKVGYMQPLRDYVDELGSVDVISVNYDTCVEQFCAANRLSYTDGFDLIWNPVQLDSRGYDVRLHKLHGSVLWYVSDAGEYMKIPVKTDSHVLTLATGGQASTLMVYPTEKWYYAEPMIQLLERTRQLLECEACRFIIVIGYSFRDDHIRRLVWEAAKKNQQSTMILVDPYAFDTYHRRLEWYDFATRNPSSLHGRVICIPVGIERVFPRLKLLCVEELRRAQAAEHEARRNELAAKSANWFECAVHYARSGHVFKSEQLMDSRVGDPLALVQSAQESANACAIRLLMMASLDHDGRKLEADELDSDVAIAFNSVIRSHHIRPTVAMTQGREPEIYLDSKDTAVFVRTLLSLCDQTLPLLWLRNGSKAEVRMRQLRLLDQYYLRRLERRQPVTLSDYAKLRRRYADGLDELRRILTFTPGDSGSLQDRSIQAQAEVLMIESQALDDVLSENPQYLAETSARESKE